MTDRTRPNTAMSYTWADVEADYPVASIARQLIVGEQMMVSRMVLEAGFHMEPHVHHNEQISIVLEGRIRFRLGEIGSDGFREETVGSGQVMVLPPYVPHGATALEPSVVFDLFSPPSEKTGIDEG